MIIYFSGTGNSYNVAQKLAEKLNDNAVPLINLIENPADYKLNEEENIGIIFPVYFGDMPDPVSKFLSNANFDKDTYFYSIATCGGSGGIALHNMKEILSAKGCKLSYGKVLTMIANSTATWKSEVKYDMHRLDKEMSTVDAVAKAVAAKKVDTSAMSSSIIGKILASDFVKSWGLKRFAISVDTNACVGCGLCTKLCPVHNLKLENNKAVFGNNCAYCMSCVHTCPHGGIKVNGHIIKKENQYRHPDTKLDEMMLR